MCLDLIVVSILSFALWLALLVLTFGLSLVILPPLFPFVAFFYNGLTVSGRQHGDARHARRRSRDADGGQRRARSLHQCGRPCRAVLRELDVSADLPGLARHADKSCLHDILSGVIFVRRDDRASRTGRSAVAENAMVEGGPDLTREPRDAPQFYLTAPSPCPYLPGREERKVFTHLIGRRAPRAQRHVDPVGLPALADDRLPAGLRMLPRLRLGAGAGRRIPPVQEFPPRRWPPTTA